MAAQRKRKHAAVEEPITGKANASAKLQKRIKSFGHVSKPNEEQIILEIHEMKQHTTRLHRAAPAVQAVLMSEKKRKRNGEAVVEHDDNTAALAHDRQAATPATPRSKRSRHVVPPSPARSAAALFDRLNINKQNSFTDPTPDQASYETPPATPDEDDASALQQLRSLYSSFLSALSLHYSHNGTASPVSVQVLLPMITKHWQKRSVSLDDLRILLAIEQRERASFSLQDHGRRGICLTRHQPRGGAVTAGAGHIDEERLNTLFESSLHQAWREWRAKAPMSGRTVEAFIDQIPLSNIVQHESVDKAASLFARGQQRLADIKSNSAAAQQTSNSRIVAGQPIAARSSQATANRGSALLDRVLAKQDLASTLPTGPSKAQLERKAALDRIEDITRVLSLLAGAKERVSFSMAITTQHLQQSLRNPISSAEVQRCLALMATEILPEFVKIVMSEGVHGVVVTRSGKVGVSELRTRLQRAAL